MEHHGPIETVDEVIECLGGNAAVRRMTKLRSFQAVCAWRDRGVIPSRFYVLMTERLKTLGRTADPKLWGQALDMQTGSGGDARGLRC